MKRESYIQIKEFLSDEIRGTEFKGHVMTVGGCVRDHIIRTPADTDLICDDDPLLILRCIRFASRYGWDIDPETMASMKRNVCRLEIITKERINDEFCKMLTCKYPVVALQLLRETGAMHYVIPELEETYEMTQNEYHFGTVWEHTLKVVQTVQDIQDDGKLTLVLAALLHDIGKIRCREVAEDGKVHFLKHELKSASSLSTTWIANPGVAGVNK